MHKFVPFTAWYNSSKPTGQLCY